MNLTASALNGVPSWNVTPCFELEGVAQAVFAGFPGFGQARHDLGGGRHPDQRLADIEHDADGRIEKGHLRVERAVDIEAEPVDQRAAVLIALDPRWADGPPLAETLPILVAASAAMPAAPA